MASFPCSNDRKIGELYTFLSGKECLAQKDLKLQRISVIPSSFNNAISYRGAFVSALQEYVQLQLTELAIKFWGAFQIRSQRKAPEKLDPGDEERYYRSQGVKMYMACKLRCLLFFFLSASAHHCGNDNSSTQPFSEQDGRGFPRKKGPSGRFYLTLNRRQKSTE